MSSMTAEQVWALVKDWPREARVDGAYYSQDRQAICDGEGLVMLDHVATHAFVGSGLAWMVNEGYMPEMYRCAEGRGIRGGVVRETMAEEETLLQAVSAAVLAAAKEGA